MRYKRFPLGALWTNGYLVWDEDGEALFVDPGGDPAEVAEYVEREGLKLRKVLLTHGHLDHIAGLEAMVPLVGDQIYIGRGDAGMLRAPSSALSALLGISCRPISAFHTLSEGDSLEVGRLRVQVMETPGHTEGGLCYFIQEGGECLLASGDTLFARSVGRTDLEGGDAEALTASLLRLGGLPDGLRVLPGHGPETTIGEERSQNPFWPR